MSQAYRKSFNRALFIFISQIGWDVNFSLLLLVIQIYYTSFVQG